MIRKTLALARIFGLVVLTILAVGTGVLWAFSVWMPSNYFWGPTDLGTVNE